MAFQQQKDRFVVSFVNRLERVIRRAHFRLERPFSLHDSAAKDSFPSLTWRFRRTASNLLLRLNVGLIEARSVALWGLLSERGVNDAIWNSYGWPHARADLPNWTMANLHKWEIHAISSYFPRPPAHILIGGAGSGRETVPLARRGFRVTAFDPSHRQFEVLAKVTRDLPGVQVFKASYQDLPWLRGDELRGISTHLAALGPFDAAIFGWGSISHLLTHAERVAALRAVADVTNGPILVSYESISDDEAAREAQNCRWRYRLPRRFHLEPHTYYDSELGFLHSLPPSEVQKLADDAGCDLAWMSVPGHSKYGHAILFDGRCTAKGDGT